ncbi:male accessory gland serine protease inhibitor-like [Drosophila kikkawai]|uniref:Male accessory gland serine protease inhibitor-like n=1 Tax=Drosophila kikkawai TaxID=30033 RepID=A0A6P4IYF8_DROKI|nr:male accessory gland serine protease inhibitor-like [Drosophila kikkawai]
MRSTSLILLSAVVALYLLGVFTTVESCKGKPATPQCEGPLDGGNKRIRRCKKNYNKAMWHFNVVTNNCTQFKYKGCAGNNNRWCSKLICETCRVRLFK